MIVSRLENFEKNKIKIFVNNYSADESKYINNNYFCFLYKTEIIKYKITENFEIPENILKKILEDLDSRTKNKCLAILGRSNQTRKNLKDKLVRAGYNNYFIEKYLDSMEEYKYLDDKQFAIDYFENNKNKKSVKAIELTLIQKGISREIIEKVIDKNLDQKDVIANLINKKLKGRQWDSLDYKEKSKIRAYIYSKGYKFPEDI